MKTKTLWIEFTTFSFKKNFKFKPWLIKSSILFQRNNVTMVTPFYEFGWGPFVFHWTNYNLEKPYTGNYKLDECSCQLNLDILSLKEKIDELSKEISNLENIISLNKRPLK